MTTGSQIQLVNHSSYDAQLLCGPCVAHQHEAFGRD